MPTITDLEYKFYGDLGYVGSMNDRRKAYARATDPGMVNANDSVTDSMMGLWALNAIEYATGNLTDLQRRDYINGSTVFNAMNSVADLAYDKFGGV